MEITGLSQKKYSFHNLRNDTLKKFAFRHRYFIFQQGKKRRQCGALARLFNAVER